ncbi:X-linked retinitis pigmentosa GTPase regulator (mRpgr) [Durusdinium trenchii]|uniref:X-linked retinitis pigmentosa GTPase regulator (MRpgr) n=1 Tax=Durusdinium trenchii TaxID=1381693 RepID=A0ABP0KYY6_9DINO
MGVDEPVHELELVEEFMQRHRCNTTRLLWVLTNCRQHTFLPTMACGQAHTVVLKGSEVFTFGEGDQGQLGHKSTENAVMPTKVGFDPRVHKDRASLQFVAVACGAKHTCLLTADGRIMGFGSNAIGQLGVAGDKEKVTEPTLFREFRETRNGPPVRFVQVVAGRFYTAALTTTGRVAVFGRGMEVDLSRGFLVMRGEMEDGEVAVQVAAGEAHLLILTDRNRIFAVGNGDFGKLAAKRNAEPDEAEELLDPENRRVVSIARMFGAVRRPALVDLPMLAPGNTIVQIAAGGNQSAFVTGAGDLYMWGSGLNGELGIGRFEKFLRSPTRVSLPASSPFAVHVACGESHTAVLTTKGAVVTFGSATFSQDGKPTAFWATNRPGAISAGELEGQANALRAVVCGGRHTAVLDVAGDLFCFGDPVCCGRRLRSPAAAKSNHLPRRLLLHPEDHIDRAQLAAFRAQRHNTV